MLMAVYTPTQVPDGDLPALRLTVVATLWSMVALLASETLKQIGRGLSGA
jgi:hypothetical protein